ncbi:MAG: ABC transporter substrate-binding protein [Pseudomonadota bacterium]
MGLAVLLPSVSVLADGLSYKNPPSLDRLVMAGRLPPVVERLPEMPHVTDPTTIGREFGRSGGKLTMLMARDKDVRQMVVYGYARLVHYTDRFDIKPDILRDIEVEEDRIFTLHLRPGHRWSDGHPFTAEDFRFYWEDIAQNEEVSPTGPPTTMRINGKLPLFEVIDEHTVRYTWPSANPMFLNLLAASAPLYIYMPAHYLKQFHVDYADPDALQERVGAASKRSWAALMNTKNKAYKNDNTDLPVLQPWVLDQAGIGTRKVFRRNAYFHRVDARGVQLPYIDKVVFTIADAKLIPAKTATGESDLQARYLRFEDYTLLKRSAGTNDYQVALWTNGRGSALALYPNLSVKDPVIRAAFRDVRVRQALSLAINRQEINQVVFYGLGKPAANMLLPLSNVSLDQAAQKFTNYDVKKAGKLLDEAGIVRDPNTGRRVLADGRPFDIIVESAGESMIESDILLLIRDSFAQLGINLITRPSQRELFRNRVYAGDAMMSVWTGLDNGIPTADMPPMEFAPVRQDHLQWPSWGQHYETGGQAGDAPDMEAAAALLGLYEAWKNAADNAERGDIWAKMQQVFTEHVFTIGTVSQVPQPVVIADHLRNVPEMAVYNWDPGGYFGVHRMDLFFRSDAQDMSQAGTR